MAKQTHLGPRPVGYSPGYTWMLLFTLLVMGGACALLYVELDGDYGFVSEPKGLPPVQKVTPLAPRDAAPPPKGLTLRAPDQPVLPVAPPEDRVALAPAPEPADLPVRFVGPVVFQMPRSFPMPGVPTR